MQDNDDALNSSDLAFRILGYLAKADKPVSIAELKDVTGSPNSTLHRLLVTLESVGYVTRQRDGYVHGLLPHHLMHRLLSSLPMWEKGNQVIQEITKVTGLSATIVIHLGWYTIRIGWSEGPHEFFQQRRIGELKLLHLDTVGLTILSLLDTESQKSYNEFIETLAHPSTCEKMKVAKLDKIRKGYDLEGFFEYPERARKNRFWAGRLLFDYNKVPKAAISFALRGEKIGKMNRENIKTITALLNDLQVLLNEKPELFWTPFDHLRPDELRFES